MKNKIQEQVLKDLDLKLKDDERYHGDSYTKQEVKNAISRTIELMEEKLIYSNQALNQINEEYNKQKADFQKMIEEVKINLKYPSSATETGRILMKQIVDIFKRKLLTKIRGTKDGTG